MLGLGHGRYVPEGSLRHALFALALLAAACGDDDTEPATSGVADQTQAETPATETEADEAGAEISFAAPDDGEVVARRFTVTMEAEGIEIEPAGEAREGAGHFHVVVDAGCVDPGEIIPSDAQHVHFGKAQTEGQVFLEPGEHDLCLQAADGLHTALPATDEIAVTVDGDAPYVSLGVPDGETVTSPVSVTMEATGVTVEPAGEVHEGAGHFHVMVDTGCIPAGETIPKDDQHVHFGDGSTSAELDLAPGAHSLCLQLGDGAHVASPLTHTVSVTVE